MVVLFIFMFINVLGFGFIFPLLPFIQVNYNLTDFQTGNIATVFAITNLFGALFFGILSDKIGRKYPLVIGTLLAGIFLALTAYANSYYQILIFRGIVGFLQGNFVVAFPAASNLSTDENRFKNMGIIGTGFSLGFLSGPALGGLLAQPSVIGGAVDLVAPFIWSGLITVAGGIMGWLWLKEPLSKLDRAVKNDLNLAATFKQLFSTRLFLIMLGLTALIALYLISLEVYLSIWLKQLFSLDPRSIGLFWAGMALLITLGQMMAPRLFNPKQALIIGLGLIAITQFALIFADSLLIAIIINYITGLGLGILFVSVNASLTLGGSANQQGFIFGLNQSFGSVGRVAGPVAIGILYTISPNTAWVALSLVFALSLLMIMFFYKKPQVKNS